MDREKQIEEMVEIVKPFVSSNVCEEESGSCELTDCRSCNAINVAQELYKAGYRKQNENSVEVVRCYDCKYCEPVIDSIIDEPRYFCTRMVGSIPIDPTDYCSRAKMKVSE